MILIIIFSGLLIISISLIFISKYYCWDDDCLIGGIATAVSVFALLICLLVIAINNSYTFCHKARIWYEQQVVQLNNTYEILINNEYNATGVQQYNTAVAEFKEEILSEQARLKNPWINWFACHEYKNMNANVVSYVEL